MITPDIISALSGALAVLLEDSADAGLVVFDLHGRIEAVNKYALMKLGLSSEGGSCFGDHLEDGSSMPSLLPGTSQSKILRFRKNSGDEIIVARCFFSFAGSSGIAMILPLSFGHEGDMRAMTRINDELSALTRKLSQRNSELEEAREQIRTLSGLLPICAHCKKIRDDGDTWEPVETYIRKRTDADFTHSYCPDCSSRMLKELNGGITK